MIEYINTKYRPLKDDVLCEYYVQAKPPLTIEDAAEQIAAESSIGTWTEIVTMNPDIAIKLKPNVYSIDKKNNIIKIAYHHELFEKGNIPQILSSIAGNIYGMKLLNNLRLIDIHFPKVLVNSFQGPAFGEKGIRKLLKVRSRPLVGTIVKPKVGLDEKQHAQVAYEAWAGGLDIVKDDENLSSMVFNNFDKRIIETLKKRNQAQKKTGERKIYMPNISAELDEMIRRAHVVKKHGGEYIMIDILTVGFSALQTIRKLNLGMVIHAHRAGHAAITRNPRHGISMLVIAKIARLIGVDQLHIGTAVGKMEGAASEVQEIGQEIEHQFIPKGKIHALNQRWFGLRSVFPVCSGGLHPGHIPPLLKIMGKNIVAQFGGGCHGHPDGTYAGAKAIRQALDATLKRRRLDTYAKNHPELAKALEKWG